MSGQILQDRAGALATVTLSNPGKRNALDAAMWQQLETSFRDLDGADDLRCILVRGAGDAFAAGGDLLEMRRLRATRDGAMAYHAQVGRALEAIAHCRHPVIAQIQGPCVGGGLEIACACDLRISGQSALFGAPINKLGFSMYPGELAGLLKLAGPAVVREILLEGRLLCAQEAFDKGLLTRIVRDDQVEEEALASANRIAAGAPLVARAHKHWITRLLGESAIGDEALRSSFDLLDSEDYREGMEAFLAKRAPQFAGR